MLPRRTCKKHDLLQLIGKLSFACKVVPAGCMFLWRLIDKSTEVGPLHHHVTLSEDTRADLYWWLAFLPSWRGSSIFIHPAWLSPVQSHLFTDASSLCGFGAFYSGHWFSGSWDPVTSSFPIAWKELYAIVLAASTWGQHWRGQRILFHCDNRAVVAKGSSKQPDIMSLVRALYFIVACLEFHIAIKHVPGCNNSIADALSRFQVDHFRRLAPEADSAHHQPPPSLQPIHNIVRDFQSSALAPSTYASYDVGVKCFIEFCSTFGLPAFPTDSLTLQLFASFLAISVKVQTIKVYLAAICHAHLLKGLTEPPSDPLLQYTLRGIRRHQGDGKRTRLPISPSTLKLLKSKLHISQWDKRMLWAAFCSAFYGFLRAAEFTSHSVHSFDPYRTLLRADVVQRGHGYTITLRASKTDPFRKGHSITLTSTATSTCPVAALDKYLTLTANIPADTQFSDGRLLTRQEVTDSICTLLASSNVQPHHFSSHSYRIGAATTAAAAGIPDWLIQTLGRWSSQCYQTYIQTPLPLIQESLRKIAAVSASQ